MEEDHEALTTTTKQGRKRKKFIRKVTCEVCGDVANDHIHYGARTCYSCRAFFRRSVTAGTKYKCGQDGNCEITKATRRQCQACRLAKCQRCGMLPSWVMTEEEKLEKKVAAETKKKLKDQALAAHARHVDLTHLPQSSYLKKRAEFRQKRRSKNKATSGAAAETPTLTGQSEEEDQDRDQDEPHASDDYSDDDVNDNDKEVDEEVEDLAELSPLRPTRRRERDASGESTSSMASQPLALRQSPVLTRLYSPEDERLVGLLVSLENQSRDQVPMSPFVKMGIMESLKSGMPFPYKVSVEGYTTAVQRLAHFISKIDAFNMINQEDRRSLIGNNCHMVVNIKSARVLNPHNNLQEQLKIAKLDVHQHASTTPLPNPLLPRIEYHQIFRSPWCCDLDDEHHYKTMMESIINLDMDEVENILMVCAAMFDVSEFKTYGYEESKELYTVGLEYYDSLIGMPPKIKRRTESGNNVISPVKTQMTNRVVKDKDLVLSIQEFYLKLLQRYLVSKHGENATIERHQDVLNKLKEMREILIRKSLQF